MPPARLRTSKPADARAPATAADLPPTRQTQTTVRSDGSCPSSLGHQAHGQMDGLGSVTGLPLLVLAHVEEERPGLRQALLPPPDRRR